MLTFRIMVTSLVATMAIAVVFAGLLRPATPLAAHLDRANVFITVATP